MFPELGTPELFYYAPPSVFLPKKFGISETHFNFANNII